MRELLVVSGATRNSPHDSSIDQAMRDFLRWVADHDATYNEAWEVWQTSCPRHSTWEDAFIDGYVRAERRVGKDQPIVVLTELGRSLVDGA